MCSIEAFQMTLHSRRSSSRLLPSYFVNVAKQEI
jgi:hypothetical protein